MDLSSLLGDTGADPNQMTTAVSETFATQGGVQGLVSKLRAGGLGPQVDSWVSTEPNQPVEPQRLGQALGPDTTNQLSQRTGLPVQALLPILAAVLPMIINHLTPNGNVPADAGTPSQTDIGSILGGLLGGGSGGLGGLLGGR
jgi:uncharacterized protein YidB (DUF937 family)